MWLILSPHPQLRMDLRSFHLKLPLSRVSIKLPLATENARGSCPSFSIIWSNLCKIWTVCFLSVHLSPRSIVTATGYHSGGAGGWGITETGSHWVWNEPNHLLQGSVTAVTEVHLADALALTLSQGLPFYTINNKNGILSSLISLLLYF